MIGGLSASGVVGAANQQLACGQQIAAPSEMARQLLDARNALDRLGSRIDSLRAALVPVLKPTNESTGVGVQAAPQPVLAPLSEGVRQIGDQIDAAVQQLEGVLNRLAI